MSKSINSASQDDENKRREFWEMMDSQRILFKVYILAVMGYYQCNSQQAGIYIGKHMKGDYSL